MLYFLCLVILLILYSCSISNGEEAKLLVYKTLETKPPVEMEDMIISYRVINNGDGPAFNIEIIDSYQKSSFEVKSIEPQNDLIVLNIPEIPPMETKTINVTVVPRVPGTYHPDRARIKYSGGADIILENDDDEDIAEETEVDLDSENPDDKINDEEKVLETGRIGYSNFIGDIEIMDSKSYYNSISWHVPEHVSYILFMVLSIFIPYYAYSGLYNSRINKINSASKESKKK